MNDGARVLIPEQTLNHTFRLDFRTNNGSLSIRPANWKYEVACQLQI